MKTLFTRCFLTLFILFCFAAPLLSSSGSAVLAQSRTGKHKPVARRASGPPFVSLAGAQFKDKKATLGKPAPESDNLPEGCYYFPGRAYGCDKVYVYANRAGRITTVSAEFSQKLTWQEALKKVGLSDKDVTATEKTLPPVSTKTRAETTLKGLKAAPPGFNVLFETVEDSAGKSEYSLTIQK